MRASVGISVFLLGFLAACGARSSLALDEDADGGGGHGSAPEQCNGVDDNDNGEIDEGLGTVECGVGACRVSVAACVSGRPAQCVPAPGSPEVCNGIDDDCNGAVDEGLGLQRIAGPYTVATSLNYLAYASIASDENGFFLAYGTGFDGSNPQTNAFYATLDATGYPQSYELPLTDRNMPNGLRISPANGGFFAAYCGRFGADDRAATALIGKGGDFSEFGVRPPSTNFCGAGTPDGIWTGQRYLFAWTDNSTMDVRLDRSDDSGESLSTELLSEQNGDLYSHPRFAMSGERVLLTYSVLVNEAFLLRVHRLDALGQDVGEPLELEAPIAGSNWTDAQIAAEPSGGFYLVARGWGGERFEARFDGDGMLVSGPTLGAERMAQHALASSSTGGYVVAWDTVGDTSEAVVERRDAAGAVTDAWFSSSDPGLGNVIFGWPTVAADHGRIVVLYSALGSGVPDHPELRAVSFGCAQMTE